MREAVRLTGAKVPDARMATMVTFLCIYLVSGMYFTFIYTHGPILPLCEHSDGSSSGVLTSRRGSKLVKEG